MQVTKFNLVSLVSDLQIMLFNVIHSNFYFECNKERGSIDQLYIELGLKYFRNLLMCSRSLVLMAERSKAGVSV